MSTVPGESTWVDAGLIPLDGDEEPPRIDDEQADADEPDEHRPAEPRPDLRGEAAEHDVVEQLIEVPDDDVEDYPAQ